MSEDLRNSYLGLPRIVNRDGSIKHIVCEGSRQHVLWWDTRGSHCSEKDCEINRRAEASDDQEAAG
jgi:hypothetical protein